MDESSSAFLHGHNIDDYVDDEMEPEGELEREPIGHNLNIPRPVQIGSLASERAARSSFVGWQDSRLQTSQQSLAPQHMPSLPVGHFLALQEENTLVGRQASVASAKRRARSAPGAQQELAFAADGQASRAALRFG